MIQRAAEDNAARLFYRVLREVGIDTPEREVRFAPPRRWRFDYAWPAHRVALEVEGGVYVGGRHSRGAGMEKDMEKYNAAAAMGWRIIRCTPRRLIHADTLDTIRRALAPLNDTDAQEEG